MEWGWWYNLTDAQAQIISSILTGLGILLGAWIGLGLVGDHVKKAKQEISNEAKKLIEEIRGQLKVVEATATAGLQVAQRSEQEQEQESLEEAGTTQPEQGDPNRREAANIVKQAQDFVRSVADNDPDGRYKRTYENIPPTYFDLLAKALQERGRFTQDQTEQAQRIVSIWKNYQKGRAARKVVPKEDLDKIREAYQRMKQA